MVSKLITLLRGTSQIPILSVDSPITKTKNENFSITPSTLNFSGNTEIYSFTIADRRLIQNGATNGGAGVEIPFTGTALSETYVGSTFTGTTLGNITLFGNNSALATSIIVVGLDSGARSTITLTVTKVAGGDSSAPANS